MILENRDMLVGCSVEHDVGTMHFEDVADTRLVPDVGEDELRISQLRHRLVLLVPQQRCSPLEQRLHPGLLLEQPSHVAGKVPQ